PPGSSSIATTFTVKGCVFDVILCWKCGVASAPLVFAITSCEPQTACSPAVSRGEAIDSITKELLTPPWLYFFCYTNVPPCSTGSTTVRVIRYSCVKKFTPSIVPPNPPAPTRYEVCNYDSYCYNDYEACMISLGNMQLTSPLGWQQHGIPDCLPMDPIPADPAPGTSSDCWLVNPGCIYE
ncbi:MAG: hypothetical protein H6586_00100, partial [Flavobacteriales bacterium]|nr:hypothetical protein [Flavobacteriales bacterium]